jgi:hypothetical protein
MKLNDLHAHYWTPRGTDYTFDSAVQEFLTVAAQTRFEMRYIGEDRWHPAPADDVALTLASYHPDLQHCLDRMLTGDEVASRLAHFRVALRQPQI